jgi:hypothetical protein
METLFETKELSTIELLKRQEAEMLATLSLLRKDLAKEEKREREAKRQQLAEILKKLIREYGEDFTKVYNEVLASEVKLVRGKPILNDDAEELEIIKYKHLFSRGYKGKNGRTFNEHGVEVKSNIPSQDCFHIKFSMSPKKYANWYEANH